MSIGNHNHHAKVDVQLFGLLNVNRWNSSCNKNWKLVTKGTRAKRWDEKKLSFIKQYTRTLNHLARYLCRGPNRYTQKPFIVCVCCWGTRKKIGLSKTKIYVYVWLKQIICFVLSLLPICTSEQQHTFARDTYATRWFSQLPVFISLSLSVECLLRFTMCPN